MTSTTTGNTVSVIGLGLMGTALAKALLANRHRVTVWNRTASKCTPLAQAGAQIAHSIEEAADASHVMVVCVLDYAVSDSLLRTPEISSRLKGKTVVQLTTGTPQEAQEAEVWAKENGVAYLDGSISGYPKDIGTPEGTILYAGSRAVFEAMQPLLHSLGGHAVSWERTLAMPPRSMGVWSPHSSLVRYSLSFTGLPSARPKAFPSTRISHSR
jgi:3-hydroxyisobutyrate dehydrogenase-like beta-hydroxyacid dehydrogenase